MDETKGLPRSRDGVDRNATYQAKSNFVDIDKKALLLIFNLLLVILGGWFVWRVEHISGNKTKEIVEPIKNDLLKEIEYIKRDLGKIETKQSDHEKRTRNIEIRLGGRK